MKKPLIILTGPTAVGKTSLSIELAKLVSGEIISADSMQVYKRMDVGSAKITKEEMDGVKHHLIDILEPTEEFNIALFKEYALKAMDEIYERGNIPLIVGGTGFYIQSLVYDVDFSESSGESSDIRKELEELYRINGADYLHNMLKEIDEESAALIHKNNVKRVIRAIEFYKETGTKISEHNLTQSENESPYNFIYFVLNDDRKKLYERIDKRVDIMFDNGLVEEVMKLKQEGLTRNNISMQGIGYKEVLDYLDGITTLDEAKYIIKRDTRHFAKRQLTWFRREKSVCFIDKDKFNYNDEAILEYIKEKLKVEGII
ncbi:MAG: tRNA (adenosine(37)-N6)-dimethylallyltransferase MiaA [Lachnospiraceae bacterium]|nr:tRNA (adenosine(37)-N6)-dimethylallyltransferase MiaA [Lachnospiraceae bacterium]